MRREHIFITTTHFDNCHKFQIFGVKKDSINQFGLVNKGDKVYFLNKKDGLIIGPYYVSSEVFYNEELIWEKKKKNKNIDVYSYRIEIKSNMLYSLDMNAFSRFIEEENIRIDSQDLTRKSVFTFLPKDYGKLQNFIKKKGKIFQKSIRKKVFKKNEITIKLAKDKGFNHSFLEFFLLKKFSELFKDESLILYNQFRINILGKKIDIIALNEEKIQIFELKKDKIIKEDIKQTKEYISWVEDGDSKNLLGKFFNKNLTNAKVEAFIIASGIDKNLLRPKNISIKKYSLNPKDNKIELLDL